MEGDAACCARAPAPIRERWADNSPLLRQALARADASEAWRARQRMCLVEAVNALVPPPGRPGRQRRRVRGPGLSARAGRRHGHRLLVSGGAGGSEGSGGALSGCGADRGQQRVQHPAGWHCHRLNGLKGGASRVLTGRELRCAHREPERDHGPGMRPYPSHTDASMLHPVYTLVYAIASTFYSDRALYQPPIAGMLVLRGGCACCRVRGGRGWPSWSRL